MRACETGCLPYHTHCPPRPNPHGSTSTHPPHRRPTKRPARREPRRGIWGVRPPDALPGGPPLARRPGTKKTPDRHPAERAPRSGAGRKAFAGGARRAAPQSSHRTFPFYWNIPVPSELTGSTRSEKCCRNLRVLAEPKRTLYAYVVQGPRPHRPGRRHRTSFDGLGTRTWYKDRVLTGRDAVTVLRPREYLT